MADETFENFDLTVLAAADGKYRIRVSSCGGEYEGPLSLPFTDPDLVALREVLEQPARDSRNFGSTSAPRKDTESRDKLRNFGRQLYESLFAEQVLVTYTNCQRTAAERSAGVRLRLHLDGVPLLADLPWEYLYDKGRGQYLATLEGSPIVRCLDIPAPPGKSSAMLVTPPVNVLVMISQPTGPATLDVAAEWENIQKALRPLVDAKLVTVKLLASRLDKDVAVGAGTADALMDELGKAESRYHVFHFIGHGRVDVQGADPVTGKPILAGKLILEGADGGPHPLDAENLRLALEHPFLRLVVLNSCDGARGAAEDPYSGLAQGLVLSQIPAVIAMQFRVSDEAAIKFAAEFYKAMIDGDKPVDAALGAARKRMVMGGHATEWGTPVLFMRGADGRVFQIDKPSAVKLRRAQIEAWATEARSAIDGRDYATAIKKLELIVDLEGKPIEP